MQQLSRTELEYLKCFSEWGEEWDVIRFRDGLLTDMYSHNLTYIIDPISDEDLSSIITSEALGSIADGKSFLNIQFDFALNPAVLDSLPHQPSEVTVYDYYLFDVERLNQLPTRDDCTLVKLDSTLLDEGLALDLRANSDMGEDFVKRRFARRSMVYLQPDMVDNYLCFSGDVAVGHCDLFISEGVAKVEDVDIAPDQQRKGYGTAMLKLLTNIALGKGAKTIYLITDHADTARDMYEKCGFSRVAQKTEMLFKL